MRHHEYSIELPYAAPRLWALFQRYDLWKEYAPAVLDVEIVYPGDAAGNGLVRKVIYPLPLGRRGESFELVKNVVPEPGLRLRHAARRPHRLDRARAGRGQSHAPALPRVVPPETPILRWFEGPIYRFINAQNEASMRGAADWLAGHPEFHPELNDA